MQVAYHALHVFDILRLSAAGVIVDGYGLLEFAYSFHFGERVRRGVGLAHDLRLIQTVRGGNHSLGAHGVLAEVRSGF